MTFNFMELRDRVTSETPVQKRKAITRHSALSFHLRRGARPSGVAMKNSIKPETGGVGSVAPGCPRTTVGAGAVESWEGGAVRFAVGVAGCPGGGGWVARPRLVRSIVVGVRAQARSAPPIVSNYTPPFVPAADRSRRQRFLFALNVRLPLR
ncbi:unnamed protein product, partial [Iphiclides podalirius]